ncbi:MAG: hypothetical protein KGI41_02790 [Patescibacteria group bacterium]|nr:hypothetical protein [Patescibacteria group bacterium]MDE1966141.1 hypothetical protein [Patescibacteria group bacterium]
MRIVIATPLYPPEIADAAAYAKELARRLAKDHAVTVVAYAHLPEELPGVRVVTVEKRQPRFARLRAFRSALARESKDADAVIAINGASVELPLILAHFPAPALFVLADASAHARAGLLERFARGRARAVVGSVPAQKPEILPLEPEPTAALAAWNATWHAHLVQFEKIFNGN